MDGGICPARPPFPSLALSTGCRPFCHPSVLASSLPPPRAAHRALTVTRPLPPPQAAHRALTVTRERASNEAKSDFMSLMCHEVRTPLNGCLASAEMLLETPLQVGCRSARPGLLLKGEPSKGQHRLRRSNALRRVKPLGPHTIIPPHTRTFTHLQEEQRELAKTICVSGAILLSTVSNFLDFFKLEAGKASVCGGGSAPNQSGVPGTISKGAWL